MSDYQTLYNVYILPSYEGMVILKKILKNK